jgi:hypothetical protein
MRLRIVLFIALLLIGHVVTASAQLLPPAQDRWLVLDTEHFAIHYRSGSESLAVNLRGIAEDTYSAFSDELGLRPKGRVLVFIQERYDVVNSLSNVIAHRSIVIFPYPPYGEPHGLLGHYDNWLRLVFTHEYAHTVDLERTEGLWDLIGTATGFGYPNALRPLWTTEGFAVWCESSIAGGGRLGSPSTDMVLRTDILSGRFRETSEWSGAYEPWPGGTLSYLYGAAFMEYLHDRYGGTVPVQFRGSTAGALPFKFAQSLPLLTEGKPFGMVLAEFYLAARTRADSTVTWIRQQGGLREGDLIACPGTTVLDFTPSGNGQELYVAANSDYRDQQIRWLDPESGRSGEVTRTDGIDVRLSARREAGDIVYSDLDIRGNTDLVSRLYKVDRATGRKEAVAGGESLFEPTVSPIDGSLLACRRRKDRSFLVRVREDRQDYPATGLPADANLFHPVWSPNGRQLAASVWLPSGRQDIFLLETPDGPARPLTSDEDWDINPVFSSDGRYVLFASDRSGVWNVYARDVASDTLLRVTNVTTGAFLPKTSPDGKWVYFVRYGVNGDEIRRLPFNPEQWTVVPLDSPPRLRSYERYLNASAAKRSLRESRSSQAERTAPSTGGAPRNEGSGRLRSLVPVLHIPLPWVDEMGLAGIVLLAGADPLGRETYGGLLGYGLESKRPLYAMSAQSYALPLVRLDLAAADYATPTNQDIRESKNAHLWRRDRLLGVRLAWPWIETTRVLESYVGLQRVQTDSLAPKDWTLRDLPRPDFLTGRATEFRAGLAFSNTRNHPLSFSPTDGLAADVGYWVRKKVLGGERTGDGVTMDVRAYKGLGRDFVVAARALALRGPDTEIGPGNLLSVSGYDSTRVTSRAVLGTGEVRFRLYEAQQRALWDWIFFRRAHGALFLQGAGYQDGSGAGWSHLWGAWGDGSPSTSRWGISSPRVGI